MKIRTSFVSNSSSSSFVVAWPKKPKTTEEIGKFLFGESTEYPNPYPWEGHPDSFSTSIVSDWLMNHLDWDKKKVRKELIGDLSAEVSYQISYIAEKYTNSYSFDNGRMVSCTTIANREIKKILALLKKHSPRVNWEKRIQAIVDYRSKWHKISEKLQKEVYKLQDKLRQEHDCVRLKWQNTEKMTKEQKAAYEKANDENYKQFQANVLEDPRYKAADEKRRKACTKSWREPKKQLETLSMIAERLADIFIAENEGAAFSVIEIADDSDFGAAMEHGTLFDNLPHKKFSHH